MIEEIQEGKHIKVSRQIVLISIKVFGAANTAVKIIITVVVGTFMTTPLMIVELTDASVISTSGIRKSEASNCEIGVFLNALGSYDKRVVLALIGSALCVAGI